MQVIFILLLPRSRALRLFMLRFLFFDIILRISGVPSSNILVYKVHWLLYEDESQKGKDERKKYKGQEKQESVKCATPVSTLCVVYSELHENAV